VLDKPFEIGDFITVDGISGTVEHVGPKTTRIRGLGGEQVVFSNSDLLKSRIRNYKRMQTRRIVFGIGVTYEIDKRQLLMVPDILREAVTHEKPDRRGGVGTGMQMMLPAGFIPLPLYRALARMRFARAEART